MALSLSLPSFSHPSLSHCRKCNLRLAWDFTQRPELRKTRNGRFGFFKIWCRSPVVQQFSSPENKTSLLKEPHKYFDQVIISVRAGDGGHGAVLTMPNQRPEKSEGKYNKEKSKKRNPSYKRDYDGSLILPVGGHGGDVVIYADEEKDSLLEFHRQKRYNAKRGGNVDSLSGLTSQLRDGLAAPTLRIPVPVGTVVKHKRGKLLADLAHPGDEVLVARGGQGGISLVEVPENRRKRMMSLTTNVMRDDSDKVLVHGQPGEEVSLELILRIVADVGLVGLPNAGKSTLLAAITCAKPDIADYPFTTLMPNLGRLDGDPQLGPYEFSSEATVADLPGLIEGAHLGKGLGRNFLRHLRRTRLLVHVVDAAAENPVNDFITVREELRMYNPDYIARPFIVVLNKIDLPQARDRLPYITKEIVETETDKAHAKLQNFSKNNSIDVTSSEYREEDSLSLEAHDTEREEDSLSLEAHDTEREENSLSLEAHDTERTGELEGNCRPLAVVGVSVLRGININEMLNEIRAALRTLRES